MQNFNSQNLTKQNFDLQYFDRILLGMRDITFDCQYHPLLYNHCFL